MMSFSFIAVMVNYYDHHRLVDELNRKCPNCRLLPLDWNNNLLSNSGYNAGNEEKRVAIGLQLARTGQWIGRETSGIIISVNE